MSMTEINASEQTEVSQKFLEWPEIEEIGKEGSMDFEFVIGQGELEM